MALSKMMLMFTFLKNETREFNFPYKKSLRGSNRVWKDGFIDSYCGYAEKLIAEYGIDGVFKFISQLQLGGGAFYSNDPNSVVTSIAHRDIKIGLTFDVFYDDTLPWSRDAEQKAIDIQQQCEEEWITKKKLFCDDEIRLTWGTFGNTDITQVWPYYYGPNAKNRYETLRRIKKHFDPTDIFHNEFTIPLPSQ